MIMIKTTDKAKKRQTPDDFIAGAAAVEGSTLSVKTKGVKMKSVAIPLGLAEKLSDYVEQKNASSYVRVSETSVIVEALALFLECKN